MSIKKYNLIISNIVIWLIVVFWYLWLSNLSFGQGLWSSSWWRGWYIEYNDWYGGKVRDYNGIVRVYNKRWWLLYQWIGTITEIWFNMEVKDGNWNIVYKTLWYTLGCETWLPWLCRLWSKTCNYNWCGNCTQTVFGVTEVCDWVDNDCDWQDDEWWVCGVCRPWDTNTIQCWFDIWCGFGSQTRTCQPNSQWWNYGACIWGAPANYWDLCNINICGSPWWTIQCNWTCSWPIPNTPTEVCDWADNDCDWQVDEWYDVWNTCSTPWQVWACIWYWIKICSINWLSTYCNASPNLPITETCNNMWIDNNCDWQIDNIPNINTTCNNWWVWACYTQWQMVCSVWWLICNAPTVMPTLEVCGDNTDNDCDGQVDEWCNCVPWDTSNRSCWSNIWACQTGIETRTCQMNGQRWARSSCIWAIWPIPQTCNNISSDSNCNGIIWDVSGLNTYCTIGTWACFTTGTMVCTVWWLSCNATVNMPSTEICDGIDNNCNWETDESPACYQCNPWEIQSISCWYTENKGICKTWSKTRTCWSDGQWGDYGACIWSIYPSIESCSNIWFDNNCDGILDNVSDINNICTVGVWACMRQWNIVCSNWWLSCNATAGVSVVEVCGDVIDNDCDGQIDEWCNCAFWTTNTILCGSNIWECKSGTQTSACQNNGTRSVYGVCIWAVGPNAEICDWKDNDCDGQVDEWSVCSTTSCTPWDKIVKPCWYDSNIGACRKWYQERICQSNSQWWNYSTCIGTVFPTQEICDDRDNNCNWYTDENWICNSCIPWDISWMPCWSISNIWSCKIGTQKMICWSNGKWSNIWACMWSILPRPEICNRQDDDCDWQSDEEGVCIIDNCPMDADKLNPWLCGCGRVDYDPDWNNICGDQRIKTNPLIYTISKYIPINIPIYENQNSYITYQPFKEQNRDSTSNKPIIEEIIDKPLIEEVATKEKNLEIQEVFDSENITNIESEISDLDVIPFLEYDDESEYIQWELYIQWYNLDILKKLFINLDKKFHILEKEQPFLKYIDLDVWDVKFEYKKNSTIMAYINKQNEPSIDIYEPLVKYVTAAKQQSNESKKLLNNQKYNTLSYPRYLKNIWLGELSKCMDIFTKQKIAIVDNAFDINHEDLKDMVFDTIDVADDDKNVIPPSESPDWYHGTAMASIAGANATNNKWIIWSSLGTAELILIKATPDGADGNDITAWPEWLAAAIKLKPNIINLSWWSFQESKTLRKIVEKWINADITIVASAGNFNKWDFFYPAAYDGVISVWAINWNSDKASFSNYGKWIAIAAPGTDIDAAIFDNKYKVFDWTSEASALVAWLISYWYAYGFTINDMIANMKPLKVDVWKWYIDFMNLCNKVNQSTEKQDKELQTDMQWDHANNIVIEHNTFETQTNQKKIVWYILGILWIILILWASYYSYRNRKDI